MSIEIWPKDGGRGGLTCELGDIEVSDPQPSRGRVGPLMLTTREYAAELLRDGPKPSPNAEGETHSVTRDGDIYAAHIDYRGRRWSWELLPAHWWDSQGPAVYLGRWRE